MELAYNGTYIICIMMVLVIWVVGTEDEETDSELRLDAVTCYIELIDKPDLPDILIKIICWVCVHRIVYAVSVVG